MINVHEIKTQEEIDEVVFRSRNVSFPSEQTVQTVQQVIDKVVEEGDKALLELTSEFDGVQIELENLEVGEDDRKAAWESLGKETQDALSKAESRITRFAKECKPVDWSKEFAPGIKVGQMVRPLHRAGIYVPGGRYPYPSSVLMSGIPAREAGVEEIIFCIPPDEDGKANKVSLGATWIVGECRVFQVGGAQAIGAMAFGTESIPNCQIIAGPGNVYVTTAKRMLSNLVSVDLEAGPSEIAVYADASTPIDYAVADLMAQLEHDPLAVAVMVSASSAVLEEAAKAFTKEGMLSSKPQPGEKIITLVNCATEEMAIDYINALAIEHLELMNSEPDRILGRIDSAGCIFTGPYS
ncbi:MAG: histidinol dehydrogenase, partial [Actinobacteria bacterium]|nr:histidinol dehydrogenase [Actinomycetota bacterium]